MEPAELERSWAITRGHLEAARAAIPLAAGDAIALQLAEYDDSLAHNELELALEQLDAIGDTLDGNCPATFWSELALAATRMGLDSRARRLRWRALADAFGQPAGAERIGTFVDSFEAATFVHANDVLPLMLAGDTYARRVSVRAMELGADLRATYRVRAEQLAGHPPSLSHPPTLAADVAALALRLGAAADQPIEVWDVSLPDGTTYSIFVLVADRAIAGCVKSADQRVVAPQRQAVDDHEL
jgi:hypothetical protein